MCMYVCSIDIQNLAFTYLCNCASRTYNWCCGSQLTENYNPSVLELCFLIYLLTVTLCLSHGSVPWSSLTLPELNGCFFFIGISLHSFQLTRILSAFSKTNVRVRLMCASGRDQEKLQTERKKGTNRGSVSVTSSTCVINYHLSYQTSSTDFSDVRAERSATRTRVARFSRKDHTHRHPPACCCCSVMWTVRSFTLQYSRERRMSRIFFF